MAKSTSDAAPAPAETRAGASISDARKVIRGHESGPYQRWEPPAVNGTRVGQSDGFSRVPKASELEALQQVAYEEVFAEATMTDSSAVSAKASLPARSRLVS